MGRRGTAAAAALLVALPVLVGACSGDDAAVPGDEVPGPSSTVGGPGVNQAGPGPFGPADEWEVQAPEEQGLNPALLEEARDYAFAEGRHTQGVVVVRNGSIVAEWYAGRAGRDSWAASWSMAKSVTSALVGIALSEGSIPSVDEPMTTYYPEWEGTPRQDMTIRHVLQMASGLDFEESYDPTDVETSDIIQLVLFQEDQLAYAADRPSRAAPGEEFSYSSGDTLLLSGVLEQATGMPVAEYARERLFEPLGFDRVEWWRDAAGTTLTYCCLDTTTRDFARFGLLYLRGGAWGDEQVVPAEWVNDSLTPSEAEEGYGYQWWLGPQGERSGEDGGEGGAAGYRAEDLPGDLFSARGHDGQYIYVVPSLDLVVVRNGDYVKHDGDPVADPSLFDRYPSGVVDDRGTRAPEAGWRDAAFLGPIVEAAEATPQDTP